MKNIPILLIIIICFFIPCFVRAATINVASCSQTDVQTAIDAANNGDTILVPAGTCVWTTTRAGYAAITIPNTKGLVIKGAGADQTVIEDTTGTAWGEWLLKLNTGEGKSYRLTGMSFIRNIDSGSSNGALIVVSGSSKNWRIDNCNVEHNTVSAGAAVGISVEGYTYGVIDHCYLKRARVLVMDLGDSAWKRPLTLGTANAVYIEDNQYDGYLNGTSILMNAVDANNGGRYVFRHNTLTGAYIEAHGSQWGRGTFSYEVYENTIIDSPTVWTPFSFRGGTGVIFNNTALNFRSDASRINIFYDRSCGPAQLACACDGSCSLDGNQDSSGWPCRDQLGRSTDFSAASIHPQADEPAYEWNNTNYLAGVPIDIDFLLNEYDCAQAALHMKSGRDYFNDTVRANYQSYVYPHPFRTDCVSYPTLCDSVSEPPADTTPPSAPTGISVI